MFDSIVEDVKRQFIQGNKITRLILINTAVFVGLYLVKLVLVMLAGFNPSTTFTQIVEALSLSSDLVYTATHPWVIITHMFLHVGLWHFIWNMLFLYWFGRIVGDLIGDDKVYPLYLLGGLFGALIYLITAPLIYGDVAIPAHGASAAVMTFVVASGVIAPEYSLRLLFIGTVRLKWVVLVILFLDIIGLANMTNTGGHMAHLGGAFFGWLYVSMMRNGTDLSVPVNNFLDGLGRLVSGQPRTVKRKRSSKVFVRHVRSRKGRAKSDTTKQSDDFQERLDKILDKIKASGYESLTEEEKEFLFRASKR